MKVMTNLIGVLNLVLSISFIINKGYIYDDFPLIIIYQNLLITGLYLVKKNDNM